MVAPFASVNFAGRGVPGEIWNRGATAPHNSDAETRWSKAFGMFQEEILAHVDKVERWMGDRDVPGPNRKFQRT